VIYPVYPRSFQDTTATVSATAAPAFAPDEGVVVLLD
jgi:hypothetical protein